MDYYNNIIGELEARETADILSTIGERIPRQNTMSLTQEILIPIIKKNVMLVELGVKMNVIKAGLSLKGAKIVSTTKLSCQSNTE